MTTPADVQRGEELADLLREYCRTRSQAAARRMLLQRPELVGLATARFVHTVRAETEQFDPVHAAQARCRLAQLADAREFGIEVAFDTKVYVHAEAHAEMYRALDDDRRVGSAAALLDLFTEFPGLVSASVARDLAADRERFRRRGDVRSTVARTMQIFLLRRCISVGVHAGVVQTLVWNQEVQRRGCTVRELADDEHWLRLAAWTGDFCGPDATLADRLAMLAEAPEFNSPAAARHAEMILRAELPADCRTQTHWGALLLAHTSCETSWEQVERVMMELSFARGLAERDDTIATGHFTEYVAAFGRRVPRDPARLVASASGGPVDPAPRLRRHAAVLERQEHDTRHVVRHLVHHVSYWDEVEALLHDHALLRQPLAIQVLDALRDSGRGRASERETWLLGRRRKLLVDCATNGVKAAVRAAMHDSESLDFHGRRPGHDRDMVRTGPVTDRDEGGAAQREAAPAAFVAHLEAADLALSGPPEEELRSLGAALSHLRRAIDAAPPGSSSRAVALGRAADAYQRRADLTGNRADADLAVAWADEALTCRPGGTGHPWLASMRLASLLLQRCGHEGNPADLGRAFLTLGPLLATLAPDNPHRSAPPPAAILVKVHELHGQAYFEATRATGFTGDRQAAVAALRKGIALCRDPSDRRQSLEAVLRTVGRGPAAVDGVPDDELATQMRECATGHHRNVFANAQTLFTSWEADAARVPAEQVRPVLVEAMNSPHPRSAVWAGSHLGILEAAEGRWDASATAYVTTLRLIHRIRRLQNADHQISWLRAGASVCAEAAFALVKAGDYGQAVLTVEEGRACVLSEMLAARQVHGLREAGHADLADEFERLTGTLRDIERCELIAARSGRTPSRVQAERLRAQLSDLVDRIGALRGLPDPYAAPDLPTVVAAAAEAPLVYLLATRFGGTALIVHGDGTLVPVDLPELTADEATSHAHRLLAARRSGSRWPAHLEKATGWLWQTAMGPLVEALGSTPHAVLVPTGPLGLLPLHAAWRPDPSAPTGRRYALDDLLLTYAVNARTLIAARKLASQPVKDRTLVVVEPLPTSGDQLPGAMTEASSVLARGRGADLGHDRVPVHDEVPVHDKVLAHNTVRVQNTVLVHDEASRSRVCAALADCGHLHFICHGTSNLAHPLESALLLADDDRLSVADFLFADLRGTRLAVLSACETAVPGSDAPDETLSLPGGLLQAGIPGVIGSQWSVPDASTVQLMTLFYELARSGDGTPYGEALRRAQQMVRDATAADKRARFGPSASPGPLVADRVRPHARPHHWAAFCLYGV